MPSSRGSSQLRDQIQVSCIAGVFFSHLSHQGSPRIQQWVAYPFSRGSSPPRNWTGVSCIAGRFFTSWATREAHIRYPVYYFSYIHNFTCLCHSWHFCTCSLSQMGPLMFITMRNIPPHKPRSQQLSLKCFTHLFLLLSHLFVDSQSCLKSSTSCHFLLQCMTVKVKWLSSVWLSVTPWTAAYQAPPSMGFSRQEYWGGVPMEYCCCC